ncbi:MAG: amidohydrolase, partial [Actinomycetes bacterium]
MGDALHLTGPLLVDRAADGEVAVRDEAWVVDGRLTFDRPAATDVTTIDGWVLPGLVDAHCHVGLDAHGAVADATSERQALTDRDAGALLLRDAGSAADTRWVDDRDDLPRIVR